MSDPLSSGSTWPLRAIIWSVALLVIFMLVYKIAFRKQAEQRNTCVDNAQAKERVATSRASVDRYLACSSPAAATAQPAANAQGQPAVPNPRCRWAGVWTSTRGTMVYEITLEPDGRFRAEPLENAPPGAGAVTGSWGVGGTGANTFAWSYDSGPVYPPDLNPISADRGDAFTLTEVDGTTTQFVRMGSSLAAECR